MCSEQIMPLPNTSPDMSPMPTHVKSSVWQSMPRSRKWRCTETHAPRAVMPIALWSYPTEPPDANASPSQNPYSFATPFAMSENVAVPLSAATTRYASSPSYRTTSDGGTISPATMLSVMSSSPEMNVLYDAIPSASQASRSTVGSGNCFA